MVSKIHISSGSISLEYEGDTEFSVSEIKGLLDQLKSLAKDLPQVTPQTTGTGAKPAEAAKSGEGIAAGLHTNTIAQKMGAATGPDLAIAAAAHLQITDQKPSFSRTELLDHMRSATSYYKQNMSGNLTKIIDTLVTNGRFNQIGASTYAISATERSLIEAKLEA